MDLELHLFIGKHTLSRAVLLTGRDWVPTTHPVHLKKPGNPAFTVNNQCSFALLYTTDQDRDSYFHDCYKAPSIPKASENIFKTKLTSLTKGKGTYDT